LRDYPKRRLEADLLFRRLLFVALLLETGLLLVLIPWSAFWDRNYFVEGWAAAGPFLTNNYTRGAITGLGLVNVWAALAELADLFGSKPQAEPNHHSTFDNLQ
jgi:hypothetical protein